MGFEHVGDRLRRFFHIGCHVGQGNFERVNLAGLVVSHLADTQSFTEVQEVLMGISLSLKLLLINSIELLLAEAVADGPRVLVGDQALEV